jgi:tetratricopeptide (TPR) repeat protein
MSSLAEGDLIAGRYRIVKIIGRGGMGEVYEAEDQLLHENIALKTVRFDRDGEDLLKRFEKEIQLARKVTHPNVCRVFEVGLHKAPNAGPALFFTMELLSGETLFERIRRAGRLTKEEAFPIIIQMAGGLAAAHASGIVHTDFKSGNVILVSAATGTRAVITDFGLAREDRTRIPEETRTLTGAHPVAGTIAYMSPEQLAGKTLTSVSDIYSFGIVLFEMACGQLPFDGRDVIHSAMQRASHHGLSVRTLAPDIDRRWEAAIVRCLKEDPKQRFRSAADLADYFRATTWRTPARYWTRREWARASIVTGLPIAAAAGTWRWVTRPFQPNAAALEWYRKGVAALHSMSYEGARKAFAQAIESEPGFALAHASLARTLDEMDYSEFAKESMLRAVTLAESGHLGAEDRKRLEALHYMVSREYDRAAPLFAQLERSAGEGERAAAVVESGWVAQLREDTESATAAYQRAIRLDGSYAAARIRLGYILGRRGGKDDLALAAFSEAERLYSDASNFEGVTESLIQRVILLNRRSRSAEAMPIIERALSIAGAVGNRYQEIQLLGWKGVAARNLGDFDRAASLAQQSIDAAITAKIGNLATVGLIDLGSSYLFRGDYTSAEAKYLQALDLARSSKVRRLEMRALTNLGSLCEQSRRPSEARGFIQQVIEFYRQAGYRRELIQATGILGGALRQLGEYEAGAKVLREAAASAVTLQDHQLESRIRERLGDNLLDQGEWPQAVQEYERAKALRTGIQAGYARVYCAQVYWRLGRAADAGRCLAEAEQLLTKTPNQRLLAEVKTTRAEMAYVAGRIADAAFAANQTEAGSGSNSEIDPVIKLMQALLLIRTGKGAEGAAQAASLVSDLEKAAMAGFAARAELSVAEAWLAVGKRQDALSLARNALAFFEPHGVWESTLRAHAVSARAGEDAAERERHMAAARSALDHLRTAWGDESLALYRRRPDIQKLLRILA